MTSRHLLRALKWGWGVIDPTEDRPSFKTSNFHKCICDAQRNISLFFVACWLLAWWPYLYAEIILSGPVPIMLTYFCCCCMHNWLFIQMKYNENKNTTKMKTVICARGKPPVQGKLIIILTSGEHVQCITLAYCTCRIHVVVLSCTFTTAIGHWPITFADCTSRGTSLV